MADDVWYIRERNKVAGPFTTAQMEGLRKRGKLASFHEVSQDRQNWQSAASLSQVFSPIPLGDPLNAAPAGPDPGHVRVDDPAKAAAVRPAVPKAPADVFTRFFRVVDFRLQRYYTIPITRILWVCYLCIATAMLMMSMMSFLFPNAFRGMMVDIYVGFSDPFGSLNREDSVLLLRLFSLSVLISTLTFFGLHIRILLELLAVPFHIANTLKEIKEGGTALRGQRPGAE